MNQRGMIAPAAMLLSVVLGTRLAYGAEFSSCREVREYFKVPLPSTSYAKVQDLEKIVAVVKAEDNSPFASCEDWVIERALWEYAHALDDYSQTFPNSPQATGVWTRRSVAAYRDYLNWFLNLSESRQARLIRVLTKSQQSPADEFRAERRRWLRARVGNVLNDMGTRLVKLKDYNSLLTEFGRLFQISVEIFPDEVVKDHWYKLLRAQPDFLRTRSRGEIRTVIASSPDSSDSWNAFKQFLILYIEANPSTRAYWAPILQEIVTWLAA